MRIEAVKVVRDYRMGPTMVHAVRKVDLVVPQGDFLCLMGPSGSGKTTLLHILGAMDRPTSGSVFLDDVDISRMSEMKRSRIRLTRFGFVFQQFYLLPSLTALQNVLLPVTEGGMHGADARKKALDLLEEVGLEKRAGHLPSQLSGGEQQRVAIARALANDPPVILGDEPTGELDSGSSVVIMNLMKKLNKEEGRTIIIATHDPDISKSAKRTVRMKDGRLKK